jgi:isoleucyl-tRNA synthetase
MEEEMAQFWVKQRIFERSIEERPESKAFVFYDGPPFATGLPHYGHLLQSAIKDCVPRYFNVRDAGSRSA